jgi:pyruvate/2-oxoglutarate dehydrogenase complex dihydrolipoamide dehydrogenase (E3) component
VAVGASPPTLGLAEPVSPSARMADRVGGHARERRIAAVGDVVAGPALAHKAGRAAVAAGRSAAGRRLRPGAIPW